MEDAGSAIETRVQSEIRAAVQNAAKYLSSQCGAKLSDHKFNELRYSLTCCGKYVMSIEDLPDPLKGVSTSSI